MKYRGEIDGLRALAVIPVILFHAGIAKFKGGFVGVDIFFVISGYLITSIIMAEKSAGTFTLTSFYERRAKRILPALLLVIACAIPVAWFILPPLELKSFAQSIMATLAFGSNILFWMQSGYFDTTAELKPLLHTWSLAVEEQYYVFFPLLIMLLWRAGAKAITVIIAAALVSSLAFAVWFYGKDQVGAFYLLPARAWEILAGAMVALIGWRSSNRTVNNIGSILGLVLVITSIFAYKKLAKLDALYAVPSVIGAVLIIQFAREGTVAHRLLTMRVFLSAGLLSYSAYLWHQPLFAFAKLRMAHDLSKPVIAALILATIVLSVLTYKFIENPTRKAKGQKSSVVIGSTLAAALVLAVIGFIGNNKLGFPGRVDSFYSAEARAIENNLNLKFTNDSQASEFYKVSPPPKETILIIGDSYVKNWSVGINENIDHSRYRVVAVTFLHCDVQINGKTITASPEESMYKEGCATLVKYLNDDSVINSTTKIFLVSYRPFEYEANLFRFALLKSLAERTGATTYIFGNYYQLEVEKTGTCMNAMFVARSDAKRCIDLAIYPSKRSPATSGEVPSDLKYTFVDIIDLMCGYDKKKCPSNSNGIPFMEDWNHLSASFVKYIFASLKQNHPKELERIGLSDAII